jgi:phage gpG-like protein
VIDLEFNAQRVPGVAQFLRSRGRSVERSVTGEMKRISVDLQSYIKEFKLSGQVLKNRTGNLRRATNQRVESEPGKSVTAIVGTGPNAAYGRTHEFGATIRIPEVKGKLMSFQVGGRRVFTMRHRAFTVTIPARSYLRSGLRDKKQSIIARLTTAVAQGVKK